MIRQLRSLFLGDTADISGADRQVGRGEGRRRGGGHGGGGGYTGANLLGRTVMIVTVLSIALQTAYSICHNDVTVQMLIYIPINTKISKFSHKDPQLHCTSSSTVNVCTSTVVFIS